ncbi:MAG: transporter [Armatimonadetes bacterium]|nr:transporter [Armatimonadota bacterium]
MSKTDVTAGATAEEEKPVPIQDNSFLIEEAYNQEDGVCQHINTFMRMRGTGDSVYTFTQEWPVGGQTHQLSYTIPILGMKDGNALVWSQGDIALNYRYQAIFDEKRGIAFAPRFSLLFPTGDVSRGTGKGGTGFQVNLPLSVQPNDKWVTHVNAGATLTPETKNAPGQKTDTTDFNLGQSVIYLADQNFNIMFEVIWNSTETLDDTGEKTRAESLFINPGVRWAHNFKSGLQIVPGISFPIGIGPSNGTQGVFFYLSLEHPFKKIRQK